LQIEPGEVYGNSSRSLHFVDGALAGTAGPARHHRCAVRSAGDWSAVAITKISAKDFMAAVCVALLPLCGFSARADLVEAQTAYAKKDYELAFREYRELAELGQPLAQFNLAVMYAKGQGIAISNTNAHAWASLAKENGEPRAAQLVAELEPQLTPTSMRISGEIQAQYGGEKLNQRLMPQFLHRDDYKERNSARALKLVPAPYPFEAQQRGVQGEAFAEYTVAPDGTARIPRILYAVPAGMFEDAVRTTLMQSTFLPARVNGVPVASSMTMFFTYKIPDARLSDYGDLGKRVASTLAKAEAGDTSAQTLYAMMLSGLPQLHQKRDQAMPWFLKAAQAGSRYSQFQVGTGLLLGRDCECDAVKGEIWLQKAAQSDQADAQVTLAQHLLEGNPSPEAVSGALVWLERASKQKNPTADLYLAALLAASPLQAVRDPMRALTLTDVAKKDYPDDPNLHEIRAAALAARGDYKAASKEQAAAIERATKLGWNLDVLQARQTLYEQGHPWTGNLLAF
jgi:uncharacterized protein